MDSFASFSSVRWRHQLEYDRSPAWATQPPWTTARCNRLLRPLSSKIACLRKSRQFELKRGGEVAGLGRGPNGKQKRTEVYSPPSANALSHENPVLQSSKTSKPDDQEWAPSPVPRKRIKRTYSSKDGGHVVRQISSKNEAYESSLLQEASIKMPDSHDFFAHRRTQASVGISGPKSANGDEPSVSGLRPQCPKSSHNTQRFPPKSFCRHARYVEPDHWKLINGLYNGLDTLLRATENGRAGDERGARSLFSTCLGKVPEYIAEEQLRSAADDPESDIDVASSVYNDLEALGSSPTGGWKPLREVIRAHGVFILGNAFKDGLLSPSLARDLIVICLHYHAYDEAQHFVECIISLMEPLQKTQSTPKRLFAHEFSVELSTLKYFVTASGRFRFLYLQIATMLSDGILPIEWISSRSMVDCWNGVISSITQEDEHARAAAALLQTTMSVANGGVCPTLAARVHRIRLLECGMISATVCKTVQSIINTPPISPPGSDSKATKIGKASTSVLSNVLTVLCAVGLLGRPTSPGLGCLRTLNLTVMQDLALTAHQALTIEGYDANGGQISESYAEQACLPFLAARLVEERACDSGKMLAPSRSVPLDIIARLSCRESLPRSAASFICAVAHCCERATSAGIFEYVHSIVNQLTNISTSSDYETTTRTLCGQIAVAAAFEYSEETNHPKHLDWAIDLEQNINGRKVETSYRTPGKTPAQRSHKSKSGYRWEEGICEWVAKTPGTLWPRAEFVHHSRTLPSDSEFESDSTTLSVSPSKQSLLDLQQRSPWLTCNTPTTARVLNKGPSHLTRYSLPKFHKPVGKTSHVGKMIETADELQALYHESIMSQKIATDDTEDELSTLKSSQELQRTGRPRLRELTNIGPSMERKRVGRWKQSGETSKRRALCLSMKPKMQQSVAGPPKVDEGFEESEDELSTLAC